MSRKFIDERYTDEIIPIEQLENEYNNECDRGEIDKQECPTFEIFLSNCLSKNRTLTEIN